MEDRESDSDPAIRVWPHRTGVILPACAAMLALAGLPLARGEAPIAQSAPAGRAGFLSREGTRLVLDGKPFRAVGVNKVELIDQYLAGLSGEVPAAPRERVTRTLDGLSARGLDTVRVYPYPFWPVDVLRTFLAADAATRAEAWRCFDEMVADCAARRIRLVVSTQFYLGMWSDLAHESLHDFITRPESQARRMHDAWLRELVGRYRDSETILFWELPNELNLYADLRPHRPAGLLATPASLTPGPVVRDSRNHFSSDEAAAFLRETALLIKSVDPNHLVGSGLSAPRTCAWHLWLGSLRRSVAMDWTADSPEEQMDYISLMTPDPVDLVCVHQYLRPDALGEADQLAIAIRAAARMNKPVYVGEFGPDPHYYAGEVYAWPAARVLVEEYLEALRALDVPIAMIWGYDEHCRVVHEPVIRPEKRPELPALLQAAQRQAKADVRWQRSPTDVDMAGTVNELKRRLAGCNW
jgi:hypothetical protein